MSRRDCDAKFATGSMDRLERFYKIDQLLKDRRLVSFAVFKALEARDD